MDIKFGQQYNLIAKPKSPASLSKASFDPPKLTELLSKIEFEDDDFLVLSSNKQSLVDRGVLESRIVELPPSDKTDKTEWVAILTEDDIQKFRKAYAIFKEVGWESHYLTSLRENPVALTIKIPDGK